MNLGTLNPCDDDFEVRVEEKLDEFLIQYPEAFFEFVENCYNPSNVMGEEAKQLAREYGFMGNAKHARIDLRVANKVAELITLYG